MPVWLLTVLSFFGAAQEAAPIIEKLLAGIGQFVGMELGRVFGNGATAKAQGIAGQAERLVDQIDQGVMDAEKWVKDMWPDVESLLAAFPGLGASLYSRHNIMADNPGVTHGVAAKVVEAAHANVRVAGK